MRRYLSTSVVALLGVLGVISAESSAASPFPKKILDAKAYDRWSWITEPAISDDGRFVAYTQVSTAGEGTLVVRSTKDDKEYRVPRGRIAHPEGGTGAPSGFTPARITPDSSFVLFVILGLPRATTDSASKDAAASALGILRLPEGTVERIPGVASFTMPEKSGRYVGYLTAAPALAKAASDGFTNRPKKMRDEIGSAADSSITTVSLRASANSATGTPDSTARGNLLTVRELQTGHRLEISDVDEFSFDSEGTFLVYALATGDARSGVYSRRLSDGFVTSILTGAGQYRNLTLDEAGKRLAFLSNQSEWTQSTPRNSVYYAPSLTTSAAPVVNASELNTDFVIAAAPGLRFVNMGRTLMFGITPAFDSATTAEAFAPLKPKPLNTSEGAAAFNAASGIPLDGRSIKELWHWKEATPLKQAVSSNQPLCGGFYMGVVQTDSRRWLQLESRETPLVLLGADGRHALGVGLHPLQDTWDVPTIDLTLIDAYTGSRRPVRENMQPREQFQLRNSHDSTLDPQRCAVTQGLVTLSATGRFAMYFENERWWSLDLQTANAVDLTGPLLGSVRFDDIPTQAQASQRLHAGTAGGVPGGIAGFTPGDRSVLLYSERDVWEMDPTGRRAPRNLTHGVGDRDNLVLRLLDQDADLAMSYPKYGVHRPMSLRGERPRFVDLAKPLLVMGVDQNTMATSVWRMPAGADSPPQNLVRMDRRLTPVAKARNVEQFLFTRESFSEFPDLWVGSRVDRLRRISDVNSQQGEYRWGTVELVDFLSDLGVELKGKLYKPEGFDPARKYPMIVAIDGLEHMSLHEYMNPQSLVGGFPGDGWPSVVSHDYILFVPDVLPTAPLPAQSAVAAVVPAVYTLLDREYVDPDRIALSGHGYGAFETQYIVTQTNMFRCAITSAGFADFIPLAMADKNYEPEMIERGYGRMGGSLWDRPYLYFGNSAIYAADHVNTPLMMVHNDNDQIIPFSQGLELYRALRRNNKEVYLFNYLGEGHTVVRRANRLDWNKRVFQFLDYYLKEGPRPEWMDAATPNGESPSAPETPPRSSAESGLRRFLDRTTVEESVTQTNQDTGNRTPHWRKR